MAHDVPVPSEHLLQCSSDLLTTHDRDGRVLWCNAAVDAVLGLAPEELVGRNPWVLVHPEDRDQVVERMLDLRERPGDTHVFSVRLQHRDGSWRHVESLARNHLDDPELRCVLLSTRDVSDRAATEARLRASETRHRSLIETAPVGFAVVDEELRLRFANPAAHAVTGMVDVQEVLGLVVTGLLEGVDRDRCARSLQTALVDRRSPPPSEYAVRWPDGTRRTVACTPLPYEWEGRPAALLMLQDVTRVRQIEDDHRRATVQLRRILEATAEGTIGIDTAGRITFMNPAAARLLALDAAAVLGEPSHPLFHHSHPDGTPYPQADCPCLHAALHGVPADVEGEVFWRSDGTPVPVEYRAVPLRTDQPSGAVVTFHDVSERLRHRERLARVAAFQSSVLDSLPALTAVLDASGRIIAVNEAWNRHLHERGGRPETSGVGVDFLAVCDRGAPESASARAVAAGTRAVLAGHVREYQVDVGCHAPDGTTIHFSLVVVPLHTPEGGAVVGYTDITRRKELEIAAAHRATHDVLTGLPNRTLLLERLEHALDGRRTTSVAVLFLDLDSFKLVNDGYGHDAGDAVLRELGERLRAHVRPSDTVARLAGDEFVVLCEDLAHPTEAYLLADRIIAAVAEPFPLGSADVTLGVSIGVALATEPGASAESLLRAADQAMFDAKSHGRNRFSVYDTDVHGRHHVRLEQALALRRLVEDDDLLVHYQPVVDLRDGRVTGAEALLRWRGTSRLTDTATAIALAEEIGLIGRIGRFVLDEATAQAATFVQPDGSALPVAVNLAPHQLDHALVAEVEQAAERAGYPMGSITLELTERSVMEDPGRAVTVLGRLRERGVRIALDDFGVGYSSLASLRDLPLDVLKIDAGFVRSLVGPRPDTRIITAIIQMSRALGLQIVAEGIEREDQRDRLLELGCAHGQGFLFSRARPADELRSMVR